MIRERRRARQLLALVAATAFACAAPPEGRIGPRVTTLRPYVWLPTLEGDATSSGGGGGFDLNLVSLDNLDFFAMARAEHESLDLGWTFLAEALTVSFERDGLVSETGFDVTMAEIGAARDAGLTTSLQWLVGVRVVDVRAHLDLFSLVELELDEAWLDPIVGARGVLIDQGSLTLDGRIDVGGFGLGSDLSLQWWLELSYAPTPGFAAFAGYRRFEVDFDDEALDFTLAGPLFGLAFSF